MAGGYAGAKERYKRGRSQTRELIEEEALTAYRFRVDVSAIDDDILRRFHRDWVGQPGRHVDWNWEQDIVPQLVSYGPRTFSAAFLVKGQLCALMAARLSPAKQWLSLTHLEGAPTDHPLRGKVIPLAIRAMFVFRAVISEKDQAEKTGLRILRPLEDALDCYRGAGFATVAKAKKDSAIVVEQPRAE
jgi:hypothetical protein